MKIKHLLLPVLFLYSWNACCQNTTLSEPQPLFVALIVSDIDSSIQWYSQILGLEVKNRIELEARGIKQANLAGTNMRVELIESQTAIHPAQILENQPRSARVGGFFKFGFSINGFDDWYAHLVRQKVEFNGQVVRDQETGKRMLIILDPDGNRIQIFEE